MTLDLSDDQAASQDYVFKFVRTARRQGSIRVSNNDANHS
jgi:hypothetical protein